MGIAERDRRRATRHGAVLSKVGAFQERRRVARDSARSQPAEEGTDVELPFDPEKEGED